MDVILSHAAHEETTVRRVSIGGYDTGSMQAEQVLDELLYWCAEHNVDEELRREIVSSYTKNGKFVLLAFIYLD